MSRNYDQHPELWPPPPTRDHDPDAEGWKADALAEQRAETWPCNDCGKPCPTGDELCQPCHDKQSKDEEWEAEHPETRCTPRE
jgi:hypothetical protein